MSEFTDNKNKRLAKLMEMATLLLETGSARWFILENEDFIARVIPSDFIALFDELIKKGIAIEQLKPLSNKILNVFNKPIENYKRIKPTEDSFLGILEQNNREMEKVLNDIKPVFKTFLAERENNAVKEQLVRHFKKLEVFAKQYTIKENVLFPVLEQVWPDYRCIQIMWSFHDDIRQKLKFILEQLNNGIEDIKAFNRSVGDVFFSMLAIKFREEKILYPYILSTINETQLAAMNLEGFEMGYPYIQPARIFDQNVADTAYKDLTDLGTGALSVEQIKLIFNHLPVDITFLDENDKVCYFSTPKKRTFPRTKAIIGREVKNCHPPESVHVVEKIVESFRNGKKNRADFWIKMKGEYIYIQYFAVRNEQGIYKGVIEVTQEISDIKAIEGEKRLLDW